MAKKTSKKNVDSGLIGKCVGVFLYNLQMFEEFRSFQAKDLKVSELKPDPEAVKDVKDGEGKSINVHVFSLLTPQVDKKYLQGIFHVSDTGIITFMISSLMFNSQNDKL